MIINRSLQVKDWRASIKIISMNKSLDWRDQFQRELNQAEAARKAGNEGMARVCARRAVGVVIRAYLTKKGVSAEKISAFRLIHSLTENPEVSPHVRELASHFTLVITRDHKLPQAVDLIADAQTLANELMG